MWNKIKERIIESWNKPADYTIADFGNLKRVKEAKEIKIANEQWRFYNAMVRVKKDFSIFKENQIGMATAYLPEDKIFAVHFGEKKWITFKNWTETDFLEHFEIVDLEE